MAVRRGDGDDVDAPFHQSAEVFENAFAVQFTESVARCRDRRADDQPEVGVARRLELRDPLLRDALDVAHREQAVQPAVIVDYQQLVDARMVGEKFVRPRDWVRGDLAYVQGLHLGAGGERLGHLAIGVAGLDHMTGQEAVQLAGGIHHGKRAEGELPLVDHLQHIADQLVGRDLDRVLNQPVYVILHAADFGELILLGHVVVDHAEPAVERHRDGHARLGHGVHVGRDDRDVQVQAVGERRVELGVARQDFGVKRGERDVVVGQAHAMVAGEKGIRRLIELFVERS